MKKNKEPRIYSMPEEFIDDTSVPAHWRVLAVLNGFFLNSGSFYGSNQWLMERLGVKSKTTIVNAVSRLESLGKIKCARTKRARVIFRDTSSLYPPCQSTGISDTSSLASNSVSNSDSINNADTRSAVPSKKKKDNGPMNVYEFVEWCRKSPQRHVQIIGEYADEIKDDKNRDIKQSFTTKEQWRAFIRRNLRVAQQLSPFTDEQISYAMERIECDKHSETNPKGFLTRWTLETLLKYITS